MYSFKSSRVLKLVLFFFLLLLSFNQLNAQSKVDYAVQKNSITTELLDSKVKVTPADTKTYFEERLNTYYERMILDNLNKDVCASCALIAWTRSLGDSKFTQANIQENVSRIRKRWTSETCPCLDVIPEKFWK